MTSSQVNINRQFRSRSNLTGIFLILLLVPAITLLAGKVPYSQEQLKTLSKVIVTGKIVAIEYETVAESSGSLTDRWTATMRPDAILKGTIPDGDLKLSYLTSGGGSVLVLCGPDQNPVPQIGDRCRAHLEEMTIFEGEQLFPVMAPNGWAILDQSGRTGESPSYRVDESVTLIELIVIISRGDQQAYLEQAAKKGIYLSVPARILLSDYGVAVLLLPVVIVMTILALWIDRRVKARAARKLSEDTDGQESE